MNLFNTFLRTKLNFSENKAVIFRGIFSISFILIVFGILFLIYINIINISNALFAIHKHTIFYYDDKLTQKEYIALIEQVHQLDSVSHIKQLSPQQLFDESLLGIAEKSEKQATLVASSLPLAIEFFLDKQNHHNTKILENIRKMAFVDKIISSANIAEYINNFFIVMKSIGIILLLFIGSIVYISCRNVLEISIYNHQKEINVYKHLGASMFFIFLPYFYEALFIMIISIFLAILMLYFLFSVSIFSISIETLNLNNIELQFITMEQILVVSLILIFLALFSFLLSFFKLIKNVTT